MRAALIPPKGYWNTICESDIHLALAQIEEPDYIRQYAAIPSGHHLIVDNGAAEGNMVPDARLIQRAIAWSADEIVVPDVMQDYAGTLQRVEHFMENHHHDLISTMKLMFVVQGTRMQQLRDCVDKFVQYPNAVLGIPRHLLTTLDDKDARKRVLDYIHLKYPGQDVHLLGTNPDYPAEIQSIARIHPWVRSCDSSMPYNYTILGLRLGERSGIVRPKNYFEHVHYLDHKLLQMNILTYQEWARGGEGAWS